MPFFSWGKGAAPADKLQGRSLELIRYDTGTGKFEVGQAALQVRQAPCWAGRALTAKPHRQA